MFHIKDKYCQSADPIQEGGADPVIEQVTDPVSDPVTPTFLDTDPTPTEGEAPQKWPDSWRQDYAGEDKSKLDRLSRYSSPTAALDGLLAAQERIRSGNLKTPFPSEGSDEAKNAWRKDNGLPDTPTGYDLNFNNGLVIGDKDKPFIDEFLQQAHEANYTNDQVRESVSWFYETRDKQIEARQDQDQQTAQETVDKLRAEWGGEYRANQNAIKAYLGTMPEDIRDNFSAARMANGTPVLSDPKVLQWMLNQSLELNPATTLVPNGGGNMASSIEDEINKNLVLMRDKSSEYWKGPNSEKIQKRHHDLLAAQAKIK